MPTLIATLDSAQVGLNGRVSPIPGGWSDDGKYINEWLKPQILMATMMEWTDRRRRFFLRLLIRGALIGVPGARAFRRYLATEAVRPGADAATFRNALALVPDIKPLVQTAAA